MKSVLCFSGLDPSGGAGISADIEAICANNGHAAPIVTALTVQDTHNVSHFETVDHNLLKQQADLLIKDLSVAAIKIGMIGSIENVKTIHDFLTSHPHIPVILDPVLTAGGGASLTRGALAEAITQWLLPYTTVATPNTVEAATLSALKTNDLQQHAAKILETGCKAVLITGTHADTQSVVNTLFTKTHAPVVFESERLPHHYHGSGCTLAASLAALIAQGLSLHEATKKALNYTWQALKHAHPVGGGQLIPNRFFNR